MDQVNNRQTKFQLTGNPFVDTGLHVLSYLTKMDAPESLTIERIAKIYKDGIELAHTNARLRSFTMVFGTNGPLTQSGYRPVGKKKILSEKNIAAYTNILLSFLQAMEKDEAEYPLCEICGVNHGFDFSSTVREGLTKAGIDNSGTKQIGREWFPLAGALGNDAQALPSASRALSICATCLFAVHYMPLGLMLMQGKLVCFQANHLRIAAELTAEITNEYQDVLKATKDKVEMLGKKEGTTAVTRRLLSWIGKLQQAKREENLPDTAAITVWKFSNAGASADCEIVEIPSRALKFLWLIRKHGYEKDLLSLLGKESKNPEYQFLTCAQTEQDYSSLYPFKSFTGADPGLFALYHQIILGETAHALKGAQTLAKARLGGLKPKEQAKIKKSGVLATNPDEYRKMRKLILDLTARNEFQPLDYQSLFPISHVHPIKVEFRGWKTIGYYLSHPDAQIPDFANHVEKNGEYMRPQQKIKQMAKLYFEDYLSRKGVEHFRKHVIDGFQKTYPNGVQWLRSVFINLAKDHPGFTTEDWDEFINDENGQPQANESLFQMRLELANFYREQIQNQSN
jgi:hypothetical protein